MSVWQASNIGAQIGQASAHRHKLRQQPAGCEARDQERKASFQQNCLKRCPTGPAASRPCTVATPGPGANRPYAVPAPAAGPRLEPHRTCSMLSPPPVSMSSCPFTCPFTLESCCWCSGGAARQGKVTACAGQKACVRLAYSGRRAWGYRHEEHER